MSADDWTIDDALAWADVHKGRSAVMLATEVRRLHSLPVLTSCGACGWSRPCAGEMWCCKHNGMPVDLDAPPPDLCPLRGAT